MPATPPRPGRIPRSSPARTPMTRKASCVGENAMASDSSAASIMSVPRRAGVSHRPVSTPLSLAGLADPRLVLVQRVRADVVDSGGLVTAEDAVVEGLQVGPGGDVVAAERTGGRRE